MKLKTIGIVLLVVSMVFLAGFLFIFTRLQDNKDTHERNEGVPGHKGSEEWEEDEDRIKMQTLFSSICGGLFAIFLLIGIILMAKWKKQEEAGQKMQPAAQQQTTCPMCGGQTTFSQEHGDYYCWNCQKYLKEMQ